MNLVDVEAAGAIFYKSPSLHQTWLQVANMVIRRTSVAIQKMGSWIALKMTHYC